MAVYRQFMQELDGSGEHLTNSLSEVDVSNTEDVKALIASGSSDVLVHFGDEAFLARYKEFEQHLPEWKQQYPKLASADMRYEGQIVLEMQGGAAAPATGAAPAADATVADATAPAVEPDAAPIDAAETPAKPKAIAVKVPAKTVAKAKAGKSAAKSAADRKSASNEKMFAALAAAQKAHAQPVSSKGGANP